MARARIVSGGKYPATAMVAEVRDALAALRPLISAQQDEIRRLFPAQQLRVLPADLERVLHLNQDALAIDY